jgi:AhpD family alkylhydroperoxidase
MSHQNPRPSYQVFSQSQKKACEALIAMGKEIDDAGFDKELSELVKLRVSLINGCAFCLQLHLNIARGMGIDGRKLDLISVWRDADLFSPREAAAFAWAEQVTLLDGKGIADHHWNALRAHFSEEEAMQLTVVIGMINTWNRVALSMRFTPPA